MGLAKSNYLVYNPIDLNNYHPCKIMVEVIIANEMH